MNLADIVAEHPLEELLREQRVFLDGIQVILQCALERTAVIRPLPDDGSRRLVALKLLDADAQDLRWKQARPMILASARGRILSKASQKANKAKKAAGPVAGTG